MATVAVKELVDYPLYIEVVIPQKIHLVQVCKYKRTTFWTKRQSSEGERTFLEYIHMEKNLYVDWCSNIGILAIYSYLKNSIPIDDKSKWSCPE